MDHHVPDGKCGPFNAESDFNSHLVHSCPRICWVSCEKKRVAPVHAREHRSVFTHSDLHPTNLLIDGGRLSGIVDWECASYKPEYWEFTKAMYGVWNNKPMENTMRRAFDDDFEEEAESGTSAMEGDAAWYLALSVYFYSYLDSTTGLSLPSWSLPPPPLFFCKIATSILLVNEIRIQLHHLYQLDNWNRAE